jgi:hypothetical protein
MRDLISLVVRVAAIFIAFSTGVGRVAAMELITAQEAALPNAVGVNIELGLRGVTRGPRVLVISPAPDAGVVRSPLNLLLNFEAHGGAVIDPRSIKMTYLKKPAINLTQRLGDLITAAGIEVRSAQAPPGTHYIKVEVKDSAGRTGSTTFAIMVED